MSEESIDEENENFEKNQQEDLQLLDANLQSRSNSMSSQKLDDLAESNQAFQQILDENKNLKQELLHLKSENEDLKQRFQLNLLATDEHHLTSDPDDIFPLKKDEYESKIEQMEYELDQYRNLYHWEKNHKRTNEDRLRRILEVGSIYFHESLTPDILINRLSKTVSNSIQYPETIISIGESDHDDLQHFQQQSEQKLLISKFKKSKKTLESNLQIATQTIEMLTLEIQAKDDIIQEFNSKDLISDFHDNSVPTKKISIFSSS